jgi:hypothetical protein
MLDRLLNLLNKCPKLWRTRRVSEHPEFIAYLNDCYPLVPLTLQIHSVLTSTSPYCAVCNKPVKTAGKVTCSVKCREIAIKQNSSQRITKQKETLKKKYGVESVAQIPGVIEKRHATLIKKYGSLVSPKTRESASNRSKDLQIKGRKTLFERYGVENPGQLPDHKDKCQATMKEHYGVTHYTQTEEFKNKSELKRYSKWEQFTPVSISINNISDADLDKQEKYENPNPVINFTCLECSNTESIPAETFKWRIQTTGTSCRCCAGLSQGSLAEKEIRDYIHSLGFDTINNSKILNGKEIDILIPKLNIGIEYHGLFWHNDLRLDSLYHSNKMIEAEQQGIRLIQIFEDEWVHCKEIVKSRLAYILNSLNCKIYARQCTIKEISLVQAKDFLMKNHIQGYANSAVKLGLFYNNDLVSVMMFSSLNKAKGHTKTPGHWELLRFCNKNNTIVVGAASKLFKYFVTHYSPTQIISFADRRWSQGNLYQQLKFNFSGNTKNNYWYIDLKKLLRIHRYKLRKNNNDNQELTEYQNRLKQGYLRIWDCGSSRWIWKP